MITNMLLIATIITYITDISGIQDTLKQLLWRWIIKDKKYQDFDWLDIHPLLKIICCSLCQTWWILLLYITINHKLTITYIAIAALMSLLTSHIAAIIRWFMDLLTTLEDILYKLITK